MAIGSRRRAAASHFMHFLSSTRAPPRRRRSGPDGALATGAVPRAVGLGLGFVMMASVMLEQGRPAWVWVAPALHAFVAPWLGGLLARRAASPRRIERATLWADHFLGGAWSALMAFNLLPCVLGLCVLSIAGGGMR